MPCCRSVAKLYLTLCDPMDCSTTGFPKLLDYMVIVCLIFWGPPTVFLEQVIFVGNVIPELPMNIFKFKGPGSVCEVRINVTSAVLNCLGLSQCCSKAGGCGAVTNPPLPRQQTFAGGCVPHEKAGHQARVETCWPTGHSLKFNNCVWITRTLTLTGRNFSLSKSNTLASLKGTYRGKHELVGSHGGHIHVSVGVSVTYRVNYELDPCTHHREETRFMNE